MIVEYLEKIKNKFIQDEIEVKVLLTNTLNEKKETIEFIKLLDVNNDPNYESFTPRQVNSFNKMKIVELQKKQKELDDMINKYEQQLCDIKNEIEEISNVIKVAREFEK